ncbi:MAG: FAD-binding protein [Firmicutes bacterium]|nr:FAD-binding protein [Bacillota bacterium]
MNEWLSSLVDIVGAPYVITHPAALKTYAQDGYTLASGMPRAVVMPGNAEEARAVVKHLYRHRIPVVARGAGTSLSGGAIPSDGAVVLHFSRMRTIRHIDWTNQIVQVDPGVINAEVTRALEPYGYFYAPDPSSQQACTIGGNFAENSGGPHCLKYGVTLNHIVMADVILANGEAVRLGSLAGEPEGLDWLGVLVGSEGTLGIATQLWLKMTESPTQSRTLAALFDEVADASEAVSDVIASGIVPAALEMMDRLAISAVERGSYPVGYPDDLAAVLLLELDGEAAVVDEEVKLVIDLMQRHHVRQVREAQSLEERALWWANRKTAFGAMGLISPDYYVQDGVIPRHLLPDALAFIDRTARRYGIRIANVFHAGDGNLHPLLLFDAANPADVERVQAAGLDILAYCVKHGGSITGEHGIGLEKLDAVRWQFTEAELAAQAMIKRLWDPDGLLNPGKVLPTPGRCVDFRP